MTTLPLRTILRLIWSAPHNPRPHRFVPLSHKHDRRDKALFALVLFLFLQTLVFSAGASHEYDQRDEHIDALVQRGLEWQHRYDALARRSDFVTIVQAGNDYQGGAQ